MIKINMWKFNNLELINNTVKLISHKVKI